MELFRTLGDERGIATNLYFLGWAAYAQGDYETARWRCEESIALFRTLGKPVFSVEALIIQANAELALGKKEVARALLEEALAFGKESESEDDIARALYGLGHLALREEKLADASTLYEQGIMMLKERWLMPRIKWVLASCLEGIGEVAAAQGQVVWTVRLFAVADAVRRSHEYFSPLGIEQPFYEHTLAAARAHLGEKTFAALWSEGRNLTSSRPMKGDEIPTLTSEVSSFDETSLLRFESVFGLTVSPQAS